MKTEGLTIQITAEMDEEVQALVSGYRRRIDELLEENDRLLHDGNREYYSKLMDCRDLLEQARLKVFAYHREIDKLLTRVDNLLDEEG